MNTLNFICCGLCALLIGTTCAEESKPLINNEITTMEEQPKRRGPKPVTPVEINAVRYDVIRGAKARGFEQDGGVIVAVDIATGKELWTLIVYQTKYDENEELDVQEVYITKLIPGQDKNTLQVENEAHKSYLVNLSTHEVVDITKK